MKAYPPRRWYPLSKAEHCRTNYDTDIIQASKIQNIIVLFYRWKTTPKSFSFTEYTSWTVWEQPWRKSVSFFVSIYLSTYLSFHLSIYLRYLSIYLFVSILGSITHLACGVLEWWLYLLVSPSEGPQL